MVNSVFTNWFTFHGNQALAAFVNQHVAIIKLILFYHCLSQSGLSGHKLVVWFQVRCGCLWLTFPALLHSIKKTVRLHCLSSPPAKRSHVQPDDRVMAHPAQTALWPPLTLQPPPHPALSTVKRMRRENARGRRGGGGWKERLIE